MEGEELYKAFEEKIEKEFIRICTSRGFLEGMFQTSPDIDQKWDSLAKDYFADAVKEFNKYPTVAISWAGYLGMAVAHRWDKDFNLFQSDRYETFYGPQKFDDMDEHITRDILKIPLASELAKRMSDLLIDMSQAALSMIRQDGIEPGTADAFQIFVRIVGVMYRVGAAIELKRLGYKMVPLYGGQSFS